MTREDEKRNPKIPDFTDLDDGHQKAEEFAHKVKFENNLANAFQKLRDTYGRAGQEFLYAELIRFQRLKKLLIST